MSSTSFGGSLTNAITPILDMFLYSMVWIIPIIMFLVMIKILVAHNMHDTPAPPRKISKQPNILNDFPVSDLSDLPTDVGEDVEVQAHTVENENVRPAIDLHKTHSDQ